jgi:hypothetical protein
MTNLSSLSLSTILSKKKRFGENLFLGPTPLHCANSCLVQVPVRQQEARKKEKKALTSFTQWVLSLMSV